jgi:hypothetical protein
MKNQTAVDFFWNKIALKLSVEQIVEFLFVFEKAKEIEKEQIIDARVSGFASSAEGWNGEIPCMKWSEMVRETKCDEYYNETYLK